MRITVIGAGYVGLVTGGCFSEMGNTVTCVDSNQAKIEGLKKGVIPIHEPGLEPIIRNNLNEGRLRFTASLAEAMVDCNIYFIAVSTPPNEDGSADLTHVLEVARELGRHMNDVCIVVNKSTVPVATAEKVRAAIQSELNRRGIKIDFDVVSNPEFLKEGDAVNDFMRPDRVIIGTDSERAITVLHKLYVPFTRNHERMLIMGVRDAEMTKYAANAMLATRISFMNEIATMCERMGVDVENVRVGIGSDSRIGYAFIYPGCGYGGSCLPKDVNALICMAEKAGVAPEVLRAVESRNQAQKQNLFEKITKRFGGNLAGYNFGLWGLAFKPGTDDMREAPSLALLDRLITSGAKVKAFDPSAMEVARQTLPSEWLKDGRVILAGHQYDALQGADAMVLVTEWKPFRNPNFDTIKRLMKRPIIFDGRNQYDPKQLNTDGFEYYSIGR